MWNVLLEFSAINGEFSSDSPDFAADNVKALSGSAQFCSRHR